METPMNFQKRSLTIEDGGIFLEFFAPPARKKNIFQPAKSSLCLLGQLGRPPFLRSCGPDFRLRLVFFFTQNFSTFLPFGLFYRLPSPGRSGRECGSGLARPLFGLFCGRHGCPGALISSQAGLCYIFCLLLSPSTFFGFYRLFSCSFLPTK